MGDGKHFEQKLVEILLSIPIVDTVIATTKSGIKCIGYEDYVFDLRYPAITFTYDSNDSEELISAKRATLILKILFSDKSDPDTMKDMADQISRSLNRNPQIFNEINFSTNSGLRVNRILKQNGYDFYDEEKELYNIIQMYATVQAENEDFTIDYQTGVWP